MKSAKSGHAVVVLVTLVLATLAPAVARAQTDPEKRARAKEHYEIATRLYDVGKYGEAINEYEAAYLLTGDPALLFNIGQAYRLWDHHEDALRVYKNYLRQRPDAPNRVDVEKKIADLEKVLEERRKAGVAPAPEPTGPPAGHEVAPAPVTGTQIAPPAAALPTEPPPASGGLAQPAGLEVGQPAAAQPGASDGRWLAYSLLGVSAASFVTLAIAGAVGASKAQKLRDASQNHDIYDPAVQTNGKTANAIAIVAGVVGLATAGTGGYLWWRSRKPAQPRLGLAPVVSPAFAGASAALTF